MELAMDIPTNSDRSRHELGVGLVVKNLFGFLDYELDLFLGYRLERPEVIDYHVELVIIMTHCLVMIGSIEFK